MKSKRFKKQFQKMNKLRSFVQMFLLFWSCMLTGCSTIRQYVSCENSLFVRIPGRPPTLAKAYREAPHSGWCFKHVVAGPRRDEDLPEAQWYLVWEKYGRHKLEKSFIGYPWKRVRMLVPEIADAVHDTFGVYPQIIEPNSTFDPVVAKKYDPTVEDIKPVPRSADLQETPVLEIEKLPKPYWPSGRKDGKFHPTWYLGSQYTQLKQARDRVLSLPGTPERNIRIGILDTGFHNAHSALSAKLRLIDEHEGDTIYSLSKTPYDDGIKARTPGTAHGSHGTGTLGLLAGGRCHIVDEWKPGNKGRETRHRVVSEIAEIGGAPDATIISVRVAPFVASVSTANLAYGIDYASRVKKCDVITMSHGGSPTNMWMDAVNAAYERGTAVFAAAGDYYNVPWSNQGVPPSATVYPAACRRVMGVSGATERQRSYALADWNWRYYGLRVFLPWNWCLMRGSYGADGVWRDMCHRGRQHEKNSTDQIEVEQMGELRANPISAFSPGTPWLALPDRNGPDGTIRKNLIGLDGGGTSASTPQAAAAAALWLAYNQKEIKRRGCWNDWKKAEAVFVAMLKSADREWARDGDAGQPTEKPENQVPNTYLGAGILKANDMLDIDFGEAMKTKGSTLKFPEERTGAIRDEFEGARSVASMLTGAYSLAKPGDLLRSRLGTDTVRRSRDNRESALSNIYFNQLVASQWQWGMQPRKAGVRESFWSRIHKWFRKNETELETKAGTLVSRYSTGQRAGR